MNFVKIGIDAGIFTLFILHHILNVRWSKALFKGKYTPYRIAQTTIVVWAMIAMLGSMISGISRDICFYRYTLFSSTLTSL